ncbi:MAG: LysM peptidoglycan-binding domain-containing protein [Treponema sp.]|nr:LysM peptidoglycan-binding domain-containing protein [Treponema sp.]
MKKILVSLVVFAVGFMLIACATPAPAPAPAPPPPAPAAPPPPAPEPTPAPPPVAVALDLTGAQQYTVVARDTLSAIARRFYGSLSSVGEAGRENGFFFPAIMLASPVVIDQDVLEPGMVLTIPDLRRNLDNPGARQAIRNALLEAANVYAGRNRPLDVEGLRRLADSL